MSDALKRIARYFRNDPVRYARIVLGVTLTPDQEKILHLLTIPPYKVLVKSAHLVGKSFLAAVACLWWYDTHDPSIVLTTAPTDKQVSIVWKEIRTLRGEWGGFVGPKVAHLQDHEKHFAKGLTARDGTAFQGHHERSVFIVFDEGVGVDPMFWESAESMLCGEEYGFLAIYNPTDQTSYAYQAEQSGTYHVVSLSALEHPNIEAELKGRVAPYPSAIRLSRLTEMIKQWSTPLQPGEQPKPTDIEFPPASGKWWRPGPIAEARLLGRWPSQASNAVWSEVTWDIAAHALISDEGPLQIGCDPARYGDNDTAIHVRKGAVSIHHESHNGWSTSQTATRLRALADEYGTKYKMEPTTIPIVIDDTGVGGGVTDQSHGYNFVPVNSASRPFDQSLYPARRSELWFDLAEQAAHGHVSFVRLDSNIKNELRAELLSPLYKIDNQGRRAVEKKDDTKKRLGKSPDNADAVLLAYARFKKYSVEVSTEEHPQTPMNTNGPYSEHVYPPLNLPQDIVWPN